jgi:translocation and assembly module TamA
VSLFAVPACCFALDVEVQGLPEAIAGQVRNAMDVDGAGDDGAVDRSQAQRRLTRGRQQLQEAMSAFGYYRARVSAELSGDTEGWKAIYKVTPGEPVTYHKVTVAVNGPAGSEESLQDYLAGDPLAAGDVVEHARYEAVKDELLERTQALGYLDAALSTHRVEIDLKAHRAEARIVVDSGPLFRFGEIRLMQQELNDDFLKGYVGFEPGDRYSDRKLLALQQAFRDSGYFEEVRVEPRVDETGPDGYVPIDVHLSAREAEEWQLGLGYGTDTGVRGSLAWQHHRINRLGHRLSSTFQLSEIGGSLEGRYTIPFGDPRRERYEIFANYTEDNPDTSDSQLGRIGVLRSVAMGRTRLDLSYTYQREDFTVAGQSGLTDLFIPGATLSRVTADNRLFARRGLRWSASVQGAPGLISDFAFFQARGSGKLIHSFGEARVILRGEAAWTAAKLSDLPASLRFFAGGDQSVRGFGYETLGPENSEGVVTGGRQLLVGSAEVDYPIADKWRVAAFIDAGNAFDDFNNREPLRKSVGIGLRRITPIGPVRVDLAHPFLGGGNDVRLHITLGPDL